MKKRTKGVTRIIYLIEERTKHQPRWQLADDAYPITSLKEAQRVARNWKRFLTRCDDPIPGYETRVAKYRRVGR